MDVQINYARTNLDSLVDKAIGDQVPVFIERKDGQQAVLVDADEYRRMAETLYLLSSPANARRLLAALERSRRGEGIEMSIAELCKRVGLEDAEITPD